MVLKIVGLTKRWSSFSLENVNIHVRRGDYYVLLGPTGSGKTLLLRTVLGFHKPDEGKIILKGRNIIDKPPEERGLRYVPQNQSLFPNMTVHQNIGFGLRVRGVDKVERNRMVYSIMDLLELREFENRFPSTLSGGERQKIALGRALVIEPQIILLDEPLSNIDAESRNRLRRELKKLHRDLKITVIHVTHDQMEAFNLATKNRGDEKWKDNPCRRLKRST